MPSQTLKNYAKKSGKSIKTVEKAWEDCKKFADKKFKDKEKDGEYWKLVNGCTKHKLGIDTKPATECLMCKW